MEELQKKYGLSDAKLKYEEKQSLKKGFSLEEWLKYKYESKELWDSFLSKWDNSFNLESSDDVREQFFWEYRDSKWSEVIEHNRIDFSKVTMEDIFKDFLRIQINIKNKHFFWFLFNNYYMGVDLTSKFQKEIRQCMNEERKNVHLNERIRCGLESLHKKDNQKFSTELIKELDKYNDEDEITIYRGFSIKGDERIKDENGKQLNGVGMSYSLDKKIAEEFSMRMNEFGYFVHIIKHYFDKYDNFVNVVIKGNNLELEKEEMNEEIYLNFIFQDLLNDYFKEMGLENKKINYISWDNFFNNKSYRDYMYENDKDFKILRNVMKDWWWKKQQSMGDGTSLLDQHSDIDTERKSYVGKYTIKKKDILTAVNNESQHMEIIAFNEDVKMIHYEIMDFDKHWNKIGIHGKSKRLEHTKE